MEKKMRLVSWIFALVIFATLVDVKPADAGFLDTRRKSPLRGKRNSPVYAIQKSFKKIFQLYKDSIVFISTTKSVPKGDYYSFFGGGSRVQRRAGLGTGFIISEDGYICTNHHVVANSDQVFVKLAGKQYRAKVVGADKQSDIALLKVKVNRKLKPVYIGDSDDVSVGDWSIAIGNPFGLDKSFTVGVISAAARDVGGYNSFLQTDASINPGNSGGPLINLNGEVIGVNRMIYSRTGGSLGIGFAIPINTAVGVLRDLKNKGSVRRGYLGVQIAQLTNRYAKSLGRRNTKGALVGGVIDDSPADRAGIRENDIIVNVNGRAIAEYRQLVKIVQKARVGEKLRMKLWRSGKELTVTVRIRERPKD